MNEVGNVLGRMLELFEAGPDRVVARRRIEQCPLSSAPAVPAGSAGTVEDTDVDGYLYVDFGEPWGVVLCEVDELSTT